MPFAEEFARIIAVEYGLVPGDVGFTKADLERFEADDITPRDLADFLGEKFNLTKIKEGRSYGIT